VFFEFETTGESVPTDLGFNFASCRAFNHFQEDKQFLDLITQGLHPLQEIVVDRPKQRTDSDGAQEEGLGEIPGLHSLQVFSNFDTTEYEPRLSPNPLGDFCIFDGCRKFVEIDSDDNINNSGSFVFEGKSPDN
jgi:hypothetical protein